jgi:uncharacterized OB-fold protein
MTARRRKRGRSPDAADRRRERRAEARRPPVEAHDPSLTLVRCEGCGRVSRNVGIDSPTVRACPVCGSETAVYVERLE